MLNDVCQFCNRDTRLLAGTAVAMLISVAPDSKSGTSSVASLLQVTSMGKHLCISMPALHRHQEYYALQVTSRVCIHGSVYIYL